MAETGDTPQDRAYRVGFKRNKREDYAVDLLRQARANLGDVDRVDAILFELGRYYNAIADAPVVSLDARKLVVELLHAGDPTAATEILDDCLARYQVAEEE